MFACKVEHYYNMTAKLKFALKTAEKWTIISCLTAKLVKCGATSALLLKTTQEATRTKTYWMFCILEIPASIDHSQVL